PEAGLNRRPRLGAAELVSVASTAARTVRTALRDRLACPRPPVPGPRTPARVVGSRPPTASLPVHPATARTRSHARSWTDPGPIERQARQAVRAGPRPGATAP